MIVELWVSGYIWNLLVELAGGVNYCKLPCKDPFTSSVTENTACLCVIGPVCGNYPEVLPPNMAEKLYITDVHNECRSKVASGNETRGRNRPASNMKAVAYDDHLEHVAQCHVYRCTTTNDECRRTEKFEVVGQNVFVSHGSERCRAVLVFRDAIAAWYEEVSRTYTKCLKYYSGCCAQYTQLAWAETTHVGCARILFLENCHVVCNYGPTGNILGRPVYKFGKRKCPPDPKYHSLCKAEPILLSDSGKFEILSLFWKWTILILAFSYFKLG